MDPQVTVRGCFVEICIVIILLAAREANVIKCVSLFKYQISNIYFIYLKDKKYTYTYTHTHTQGLGGRMGKCIADIYSRELQKMNFQPFLKLNADREQLGLTICVLQISKIMVSSAV